MPPFSSVLGASSVVKPGVCTSATRPSVPYEGQLIYETDTDRVAAYNGSAWFYTHSSGLVFISSTTIGSAVSSVTVSNVFSSTYDNYKIIVSGGAMSTNENLTLVLGATSTGYYMGYINVGYAAGTSSSLADNNAAAWSRVGAGNTNGIFANFDLFAPNLAKNTNIAGSIGNPDTGANSRQFSGYLNNTTQYTAFTLGVAGAATITGGTIRVYGYANS